MQVALFAIRDIGAGEEIVRAKTGAIDPSSWEVPKAAAHARGASSQAQGKTSEVDLPRPLLVDRHFESRGMPLGDKREDWGFYSGGDEEVSATRRIQRLATESQPGEKRVSK